MYRETYCARTGPLPLLPSGPGGVGGIAPRRTRHMHHDSTQKGRRSWQRYRCLCRVCALMSAKMEV